MYPFVIGLFGAAATTPRVISYSPSHGEVTTSITITGIRFTGVTDVSFNGTSASFFFISDTEIVAVVPNGATTGAISVTTPEGTGVGPSFTVDANSFAFDLTTETLPAAVTAARTGDTLYPMRSATTAEATATAECFEDKGDGRGGGQWVFAGYYNTAKPFNFALGQAGPNGSGWGFAGTAPVITANNAVAPDGTTTASKIEDDQVGATAQVVCTGNDGSPTDVASIASIWVKDPTVGAPTTVGGIGPRTDGGNPVSLEQSTSWRRITTRWFKAGTPAYEYIQFFPAGATCTPADFAGGSFAYTPAAVGSSWFWGAQACRSNSAPPLVDGTTGDLTLDFDPTNVLLANGDLHLEGAFLTLGTGDGLPWSPEVSGSDQAPVAVDAECLVSMDTPNGECALYRGQQLVVNGYLNGTTVIGGTTLALNTGALQACEFRWELWNRPSVNDSGMQMWINGCRFGQILCPASVAQAQPTTGYLGHRNGTKFTERRHTLLRKTTRDPDTVEGVILGDSLLSVYSSGMPAVGSLIYTIAESRSRDGIVSYAVAGSTVQAQQALFDASAQVGMASVAWFIIQVGINNLDGGESAAVVIGRLQTLITDINTSNPTAKILFGQITPCLGGVGAAVWAKVLTVNEAIAGNGATPITGSNIVRVPAWTAMNDGVGNLIAAYDLGDGLHTNLDGRTYQGDTYADELVAEGLL